MTAGLKLAAVVSTVAFVLGALAIGGGTPVSPAAIAGASRSAAAEVACAAEIIDHAARDTEALATIARNVRSQLESSRRLLDLQLQIEESSRASASRSRALADRISEIEESLERLSGRLARLSRASGESVAVSEDTAEVARSLQAMLDAFERRFEVTVSESRELNRRARGFARLKEPLP